MIHYLILFAISMLPIVELRGAIPYAVANDLNLLLSFPLSVIGNLLPIPFLLLYGGKVLRYFAKFDKIGWPFRKILELGEKKVTKKITSMEKSLFLGLLAFVAIPLPGTGAWTGALVAITLNLDFKKSFWPIALGVVIAGFIMAFVSVGVDAIVQSIV
ncbi:MAG: small multi-drug export protein [Clostridia bacterium]|nr:small multi-drug export protein [Clostridia bacterium]MBR6754529.1 small multi-drug export protein [Clostridia bacterium]